MLAIQWTIFMNSVNHGFWKRLVLRFQNNEGMWKMQSYMKLVEKEERQILFMGVEEAKFRFY
jgi:hypothetical protein